MKTNKKLGVIVARFQTPKLHRGHKSLINLALKENKDVVIFLGVCTVRSYKNPLDFEHRKHLVYSQIHVPENKSLKIRPLQDMKRNEDWVKNLNSSIYFFCKKSKNVTIYGSKDSFLQVYKQYPSVGYNIKEMKPVVSKLNDLLSATESRQIIQELDKATLIAEKSSFTVGYIKAVQEEYKASFSVVDIVPIDTKHRVLIGHKKNSGWCLIGGFADAKHDNSLEQAAVRELKEETGLVIKRRSEVTYFKSYKCNDWRYKDYPQPFTSVMLTTVDFCLKTAIANNKLKAADDLDRITAIKLNRKNIIKYFPVVFSTHRTILLDILDDLKLDK